MTDLTYSLIYLLSYLFMYLLIYLFSDCPGAEEDRELPLHGSRRGQAILHKRQTPEDLSLLLGGASLVARS